MSRSTKCTLLSGLFAALFLFAAIGICTASAHIRIHHRQPQIVNNAADWRRLSMVDEYGAIPADAMGRALRQKALLARKPGSSAGQWSEQGPSNLAGRTCCLVIDPASPLTMWMGAAGGGVWRSYDGGTTWNPVGDHLASLAVNALTIDPNNTNTLYAGTGEGYYNLDAIGGFGIFKSTDGGDTWNQLPATAGFPHINRIAVDPANSLIILASVQPGGIYRSADGGSTWKQVLSVQSGQALAFSPSNTNRVVGSILDQDSTSGAWFNSAVVSNDAGQTWTKATGGLNALTGMGRIETTPLIKDANTVYASATDGNVWKSTNGGASYTIVTTSAPSDATLTADSIWVDPTNSNRVVVGGQSVFESIDGGVTLQLVGQGGIQTAQPHPNIHCIVGSPAYDGVTNKSVYVCTSGGVFEAPDITLATTGLGWLAHYQGARTSQFYSVAGDATSGLIFGGLQDNGNQSLDEGLFLSNDISSAFGNDGGYVAIDPTNASNLYGEGGFLQVFQSTDGGLDCEQITTGLTDATTSNSNYIAPMIIDPNNPKVLLAGGASLWRCENAGSSVPIWNPIRPPGSAFISAIAIAPGNSDLIWVGQNDGSIAMTTNGTSAQPDWMTVSGPGVSSPVPNRYITRLLVDPSNSNVVYVSLGGFTSNNLWESIDGGTTWDSITGGGAAILPEVPIRAIARKPGSPNSLYVGTEVGIFSTTNGGQTWTMSSDLDVNVSVDELTYMNNSNSLLAATHGRGVWILPGGATTISSLTISPTSVLGGVSAQGKITLSQAAGALGATVNVSVNSTDVQTPATVIVPEGALSTTFQLTTNGVAGSETVTVLASLGASQQTASLTITPPTLSAVSVSPTSLVGGNSAIGAVTLTGVAPTGGTVIGLSSSAGQALTPTTVTVPSGSASVTFPITTSGVAKAVTATITAKQGDTTETASLAIQPASLQDLAISPTSVTGGNPAIGVVTLTGYAPIGGVVVKISSNTKSATVPASITVASGSNSATFSIGASVVTKATSAAITAAQGLLSHTVPLEIVPTGLQSLSLSPKTVIGGSNVVVTGEITFTGPAPASGETVVLTSSNLKVATVPGSVRVSAGKLAVTFTVTHLQVTSTKTTTITAACGGISQTATLTSNPFQVSSVSVSPADVVGGANVAGVVNLNAIPGVRGGSVIVKLSSTSSAVKLPASVNVLVGAASGKFSIQTTPVSKSTTTTITAGLNAASQQANLTLLPPSLLSVAVKPNSVKGSSTTVVTGVVTLSSAAPSGGIVVNLSSSNAAAASVPLTVTVASGKLSASFTIHHSQVDGKTTVTITASDSGTVKTTTLSVTH